MPKLWKGGGDKIKIIRCKKWKTCKYSVSPYGSLVVWYCDKRYKNKNKDIFCKYFPIRIIDMYKKEIK